MKRGSIVRELMWEEINKLLMMNYDERIYGMRVYVGRNKQTLNDENFRCFFPD